MANLYIYANTTSVSNMTATIGTITRQASYSNTCKLSTGGTYAANIRYLWGGVTSTAEETLTVTGITNAKIYAATERTGTYTDITALTNTSAGSNSFSFQFIDDESTSYSYMVVVPQAASNTITIGTLTNCTANYSSGDDVDTSKNLVITANTGYEFASSDAYTYRVGTTEKDFTVSDDLTTLTADFSGISASVRIGNITATAKETPTPTTPKITLGTLTNCTANYSSGDDVDTSKNLVITADTGYEFAESDYYYTVGGTSISFTKSANNNTLTAITTNVTQDLSVGNITATATATTELGKVYISGTIANATCNYSNGEQITTSKTLLITPNSGYEFRGVFTYTENDETLNLLTNYDGALYIEFTTENTNDIYLDGNYTATIKAETISNFANIYKVTNDILNRIASLRFTDSSGEVTDKGSYITQLYKSYITIPASVIGDSTQIVLGNYSTSLQAPLMIDSSFTVDLGKINIKGKYQNAYDYLDTETTLYTSFFGGITLDTSLTMDRELHLAERFDFYSGEVTLSVTTDEGYEVQQSTQAINSIPIVQFTTGGTIGQLESNHYSLYDSSYVLVTRNIPYQSSNIFGREVVKNGTMAELKGYTRVDAIKLETTATKAEQDEIVNQLQTGFYIL